MRKNMDLETKLADDRRQVRPAKRPTPGMPFCHASGHTSEEIATFWAKYRDDLYWGYNMAGNVRPGRGNGELGRWPGRRRTPDNL